MLQLEILVGETLTVNRLPTYSSAVSEVPALYHELRYYSMEDGSFEVKRFSL
jgi:hypothetical protein